MNRKPLSNPREEHLLKLLAVANARIAQLERQTVLVPLPKQESDKPAAIQPALGRRLAARA